MAGDTITPEQVRQVANLASLRLSDEEVARLGTELGHILGYMASLDVLDVSQVEPTCHPVALSGHLRPDEVVPSEPRELYLRSAPKTEAGGFAVPKVLEGEG